MSPHASDHGPHMPAYIRAGAPIMSDALIQAFDECGVDNLETYPCEITDPDDGTIHTNYKVVNVVGLVSAADMEASDATVHESGDPIIDVDFDELVIDDSKAKGLLFFRLRESTNALIARKKVKEYIEKKGFTDVIFHKPEDVAL